MDRKKQFTQQENQIGISPAMYWGTIVLGVIGLVTVVSALAVILHLPRTAVVSFAVSLYGLTIAAAIAAMILTLRELGAAIGASRVKATISARKHASSN